MNAARSRIVGALFVSVGALAGAACASVFGFEPLSVGSDDASTAADSQTPAMDASPDAGIPDTGPVCSHSQWPGRPDAAAGGATTFISAVDVLDIGVASDGGPNGVAPGFDIDDFCTVTFDQNSCAATIDTSKFQTYVEDIGGLAGGVDNATYSLFVFSSLVGQAINPQVVNGGLQAGTYGVLARIDGYNGLPDDPDVFAEWIPTLGVEGSPLADGGPPAPTFTPSDVWIRDEQFWNQATYDTSLIIDQSAYVTGGKLVAHVDGLTLNIPIFGGIMTLSLNDAVVVADVVSVPDSTSLDGGTTFRLTNGLFAGRWATKNFLAGIRPLVALGDHICLEPGSYLAAKQTICPARDIASRAAFDTQGISCDAISVGIRFDTGLAAQHKDYESLPDGGDPCAASGISPDDDCD